MAEYIKNNVQLQILAVFVAMPLMIWAVGSHPERTVLKESLSVATIVAFSLMVGLFYLARPNRAAARRIKFSNLLSWHKTIGYVVVPVLLVHPFLLVVPRFFEAGVAPGEAFGTIATTFSSNGIQLGLTAWCLLLLLGITSLARKVLPLKYPTWRRVHGVLALLCMACTAFHVVDLGRHTDAAMTAFIVLLSSGGIYLLLRNYADKGPLVSEKI